MPRAEISTHQAQFTLEKLHAELGGKIKDNKSEAESLRQSMEHVEAVLKLLIPGYSARAISVRRRAPNPFFKRGTVFRSAIDVMKGTTTPMSAGEIATIMLKRKGVESSEKNVWRDLTSAVQASLVNHDGETVTGTGHHPVKWTIKNTETSL